MKNYIIYTLILIATLSFFSCNSDEEMSAMEDDQEALEKQFSEIQTLALSAQCIDSSDWSYTAYGAKACGGPQGYIPYYLKADTALLFAQLNSYEANEIAFNRRWDIVSTCDIPQEPSGVTCVENKAKLVYN